MGVSRANHYKPPANAGFTVIELLMVLGIIGLMLLLIFQAIPALQRNSRNGQRKQDVATVLQAVSRYQLNNSGNFPEESPDCDTQTNTDCFRHKVELYHYEFDDVTVEDNPALDPAVRFSTEIDKVEVRHYYKCNDEGRASSQGAGYRDIVALYGIEGGGGAAFPQCQQV